MAVVGGILAAWAPAKAYDVGDAMIIVGDVSSAIAKSRKDFSEITRSLDQAYDLVREQRLTTNFSLRIWESVDKAEDAAKSFRKIKPKPLKPLTSRQGLREITQGRSENATLPEGLTIAEGKAAIEIRKGEIAKLRSARKDLREAVEDARRESDTASQLGRELENVQARGGVGLEWAYSIAMPGQSFALTTGAYKAFVVDAYALRFNEGQDALKRLTDVIELAESDLLDFDVFIALLEFRNGKDPLGELNSAVDKANPYYSPRRDDFIKSELAAMEARQKRIFEKVEKLRAEADAIDQHNGRLEEMRRIVAAVGAVAGAVGGNSENASDKEAPAGANVAAPAPSASVPTAGVAAPKATIPVNRPATPTTRQPVPLDPLPEQPPVRLRDLE